VQQSSCRDISTLALTHCRRLATGLVLVLVPCSRSRCGNEHDECHQHVFMAVH